MSSHPSSELPDDRRLGVSWWTVGLFALLLAAADGFWATSVRGAVGFIQNVDQPFHDWLFYLAVMLPIFAATIYLAIRLAQRFAAGRSGLVRVTLAAALVVVVTTVVAIAQISLTAVYDYHSQQAQIALMHHIHNQNGPTEIRLDPGVTVAPGQPSCTGLCAEKQQTIDVPVTHEEVVVERPKPSREFELADDDSPDTSQDIQALRRRARRLARQAALDPGDGMDL